MELKQSILSDPVLLKNGYAFPSYDSAKVKAATLNEPTWLHLGAGNIFRAFLGSCQQKLLNRGLAKTGIIVAEGYDYEIVDVLRQYEELTVNVTLKESGEVEKESNGLTLPGWEPERLARIKDLFVAYEGFDEKRLRANFKYFMDAIIPTCEAYDIKMAIHPDDPPFSIFGLPRLVNNIENIDQLLAVNPSPYNGLTFCTGSLGADPSNDLVKMIARYHDRIHFMHVRNVRVDANGDFSEVSHRTQDGTVDITGVMAALAKIDYSGYLRPDHGRHIFGENASNVRPGYGLYDRALGAMYLAGSWDMARKIQHAGD